MSNKKAGSARSQYAKQNLLIFNYIAAFPPSVLFCRGCVPDDPYSVRLIGRYGNDPKNRQPTPY